jgi:cell division septation protein DedD
VDAAAPVPAVTAYVAQLSSLNTEANAQAEYNRVRSAHSAIVGSLTPLITPAELGTTGTIFRLSLGPLASKEAASKLCAQLIAAGEKDCIVRRQ